MPIVSRRRIGRIIKERGLVSAYTRKKYRVHAVRSNEAAVPILFDLDAREVIGYSAGAYKNAELVHKAFSTVKGSLFDIQMFHTDRGSEFDNALIDELLESFQINRSLSMKGRPYDNAVAESTFKRIKAEFVSCRRLGILDQLQLELADYVHWFNNVRLHGTLGYLSPAELKETYTL